MSLGLQRGTVKLFDHDPSWAEDFASEKVAPQKTLGVKMLGVEHVGSTAIPGIKAKPILDLMVAVPSLDGWKEFERPLEQLGYKFRTDFREYGGHVLFVKGPEEKRTHYLKLTELNSDFWEEHILFRDFLTEHQEYAKKYEKLKEGLLQEHGGDRGPYTAGKKEFVHKILRLAGFTGRMV